ncbi:MAG: glycosyltransferase family 9 protein, partial [Bryocella sp.]
GVPLTEEMQQNLPRSKRTLGAKETTWYEQEGERLARCVRELGDAAIDDPASWAPGFTSEERTEASWLLQPLKGSPFFALSLGTKAQSNHWGADNWSALIEKLSGESPGHALVLIGAPDEFAECESVASKWAGQVLNLCGACSPRVSGAVIERAELFLGHDSGPAHMAAAAGTPVVGVFSSRMASGTWVPHGEHVRVVLHWVECGGCQLMTCIEQRKKCILSIGVDEVLDVVREQRKAGR